MRTADHFYYHEPSKLYVPSVAKVLDVISKGNALIGWVKKLITDYLIKFCQGGGVLNLKNVFSIVEELKQLNETALSEAGDFGTNIHNFLEAIGKGIPINLEALTPKQRRCVEAFISWKDTNVKGFLETEQKLCTPDYGGTLDAVVQLKDGRIALLDYKTSAYIYDTYDLQCAAYVKAYELNTGRRIDTAFILRFEKKDDKKQEMQEKEVVEIDYKYDLFVSALKLWSFINRKKIEEVNSANVVQ